MKVVCSYCMVIIKETAEVCLSQTGEELFSHGACSDCNRKAMKQVKQDEKKFYLSREGCSYIMT